MMVFEDRVTLRQLRALAAVAEAGTVTGAGQKLNLTQPAVTLQLRALQGMIGLPVIERVNERTALTEVGRELLALHHRLTAAVADCAASIDAIKGLSGGTISIGAVSTAKYFVPFGIAAFSRKYPEIVIRLSIGNRAQILTSLRNYGLDVAVTGRPPEDMDLERVLIGDHPHVIIAPHEHAFARRRKIPLDQLGNETFLVREPDSGTRILMSQTFALRGFQPKIGMEIDSNETIKQAVMAGLGVAFISGHTVATELAEGRLVELDVVGLPIVRQWYVVYRRDRELLPPALALARFLAGESNRFLPKGPRR
jgi:LysR family transcriptional regulator, low CO2-responsive transcriptional regulator